MLTPQEQQGIKHRRALEKLCRVPVDDLCSRALSAQAEIGALVRFMMARHGKCFICIELQFLILDVVAQAVWGGAS